MWFSLAVHRNCSEFLTILNPYSWTLFEGLTSIYLFRQALIQISRGRPFRWFYPWFAPNLGVCRRCHWHPGFSLWAARHKKFFHAECFTGSFKQIMNLLWSPFWWFSANKEDCRVACLQAIGCLASFAGAYKAFHFRSVHWVRDVLKFLICKAFFCRLLRGRIGLFKINRCPTSSFHLPDGTIQQSDVKWMVLAPPNLVKWSLSQGNQSNGVQIFRSNDLPASSHFELIYSTAYLRY